MKNLLLRWIIAAVSLYLTALLAEPLGIGIVLKGFITPFLAVIVLALINTFIRPLLVFMTLPLNCMTLGLFTVVINALMFWLVGSVSSGFRVDGFLAALFGSVVMSIISGIASHFTGVNERN